jgi:UDP-N-acetylglucosamine:LPS N-acetylglucosamine transferase
MTADAGLGHRRSAEAIEAALHELYDDQCHVRVINPVDEADTPRLVQRLEEDYDQHVTQQPGLYRLAYHAVDAPLVTEMAQQIAALLLQNSMREIVRRYQFDAVVSTHLTHSHPAIEAIKKEKAAIPFSIVVTDLTDVQRLWFNDRADMHFVPSEAVRQQALDNDISKQRVRVTGIPVQPEFSLEQRSQGELRQELGWDDDLPTALLVASHRTQQLGSIARMLDRSGEQVQLVVVCGGDQEMFDQLSIYDWQGPIKLYNWVDQMPQMLKAADFIITKAGGLIVSESLACGLPLILSEALPGQEAGNARYVVKNNVGAWAPGPGEVLATVHSWLKDEARGLRKMRENARNLGRPRAAFDIAEALWHMA